MKHFVACLGLVLALGGCASDRGPQVACRGAVAGPTRTYTMATAGGGPEIAAVGAALERQLAAQGFVRADSDPAYLVEILQGERPGQVGAYPDVGQDGQPAWLVTPTRAVWWRTKAPSVDQVTIRFLDAKTGAETYRVSALNVSDAKRKAAADRFDALVQAALPGQPCPNAAARQAGV